MNTGFGEKEYCFANSDQERFGGVNLISFYKLRNITLFRGEIELVSCSSTRKKDNSESCRVLYFVPLFASCNFISMLSVPPIRNRIHWEIRRLAREWTFCPLSNSEVYWFPLCSPCFFFLILYRLPTWYFQSRSFIFRRPNRFRIIHSLNSAYK